MVVVRVLESAWQSCALAGNREPRDVPSIPAGCRHRLHQWFVPDAGRAVHRRFRVGPVLSAPGSLCEPTKKPILLKPVTDVLAAQWVLESLKPFNTYCVGSVVPPVFACYARIFHPGWRVAGDIRIPVRWSEMAAHTGRTAHRLMQWPSFLGMSRIDDFVNADGTVIAPPDEGTLPTAVYLPLRVVLASHTDCRGVWLAVWPGFGQDYKNFVPDTASIDRGQRWWDLFRAPLDQMDLSFYEGMDQTANMIWPDDHSWCLATDIDLNTTYIGGREPLIQDLLAGDALEVWPAEPDDDISFNADTLNAR